MRRFNERDLIRFARNYLKPKKKRSFMDKFMDKLFVGRPLEDITLRDKVMLNIGYLKAQKDMRDED